MARHARKAKKTEADKDDGKSSGVMCCKPPEKLAVPCARVSSDGEWFPIERVLDTVCLVGSNMPWQSLVQWQPNWSAKVHSSSALRDFNGRATVLNCVVRNDVLRSRVRRKMKWDRQEFMSCNFRVRIQHPDESVTLELLPYSDVKRRFPAALFEFMENRMPLPRILDGNERRPDGLLPIYNNSNISRALFSKKYRVQQEMNVVNGHATMDVQNIVPFNSEANSTSLKEEEPLISSELLNGIVADITPFESNLSTENNGRAKRSKKLKIFGLSGLRSKAAELHHKDLESKNAATVKSPEEFVDMNSCKLGAEIRKMQEFSKLLVVQRKHPSEEENILLSKKDNSPCEGERCLRRVRQPMKTYSKQINEKWTSPIIKRTGGDFRRNSFDAGHENHSIEGGRSLGYKRKAPLRSRNSLENNIASKSQNCSNVVRRGAGLQCVEC